MTDHLTIIAELCAAAGVHWNERALVLALARAGECAADVVTAQLTVSALALALDASERTVKRRRAQLAARGLSWLTLEPGPWGYRLLINLSATPGGGDTGVTERGQRGDTGVTTPGQSGAKGVTERGQRGDSDASRTHADISHAGAPASSAPTDYVSSRLASRLAAHEPAREDGERQPAGQPVVAVAMEVEEELAAWLHRQLTDRHASLTQHGDSEVPTVGALRAASASIVSAMGGEAEARCYCDQRLLAFELRPPAARPGQLSRLVGWLVRDAAQPDLRAAAAEAVLAASQPPTPPPARRAPEAPRPQGARRAGASQALYTDGYDEALDAAIAHGTRNAHLAPPPSDALYQARCLQEWKAAKHFGLVPKDEPYSEAALDKYGLRPEREAFTSPKSREVTR